MSSLFSKKIFFFRSVQATGGEDPGTSRIKFGDLEGRHAIQDGEFHVIFSFFPLFFLPGPPAARPPPWTVSGAL